MGSVGELSYREWLDRREKLERPVKLATTYLRKAGMFLSAYDSEPQISHWYWDLVDQAIETATDIVNALPDAFFESVKLEDHLGLGLTDLGSYRRSDDTLEKALALLDAIRTRLSRDDALRRIAALERTEGCTPHEAAARLAKAAELRAKVDG